MVIGKKKESIIDNCTLEWYRIGKKEELVARGNQYYTSVDVLFIILRMLVVEYNYVVIMVMKCL